MSGFWNILGIPKARGGVASEQEKFVHDPKITDAQGYRYLAG